MSAIETQTDIYKDLEDWYVTEKPLFDSLSKKVGSLIEDILEKNNVEYHSITFRAKDVESLITKAKSKKYKNPKEQIQDFAGIRIITFVKSDVTKVCNLIKPEFIIDEKNSSDKGEELGDDKVGYRSVHYIAKFNEARTSLFEYSHFKDKCFEIQIRTILEHAWADISHDRTYKFNNSLPEKNDIKRRFALAAASLEMVDREFDRLSNELEEYSIEITNDTVKGNLEHEIDGTSLMAYVQNKFSIPIAKKMIKPTFMKSEKNVIDELGQMGINTLNDLDNIIDKIVETKKVSIDEIVIDSSNLLGLFRNIMIIHDPEKYFENAWQGKWSGIDHDDIEYFGKFGLDYLKIATNYGLSLEEDEYEDEDEYK
ncbi:hypothetical protein [Metabacillus sp. FJAT-53654]|uniref:RelA/SpoT domain-containing protein n=1 Tax=Metabacillus rhizosphaerae TaxID=3117747 RepID=A0ABZ2MPB2_9BACI